MIIAGAGVLLAFLLWAAVVLFATELGVPTTDVTRYRNVLAVFPHADDEALNCGGVLHRLSASGAAVTLVLLTTGERGTPDGTPSARLARARVDEARRAARVLGVTELAQEDLGDGRVRERRADLAASLDRTVARVRPDLVITYDRSGLYGHDDHMVCSEVLTELVQARFPQVALWYVTLARRLQPWVKLDESLRERRAAPTHKAFVGAHLLAKTRALLAHRSQRRPGWFLLSLLPFEHFASPPSPGFAHPSSSTRRNAPR